MAAWILQHYHDILQSPRQVAYIELGPGRGTLAAQMLSALGMMPGGQQLLQAMCIHLVEVSPDLRRVQADALQCTHATTESATQPEAEVRVRARRCTTHVGELARWCSTRHVYRRPTVHTH
jgi:SAM-dependent MidA family methyltransferase